MIFMEEDKSKFERGDIVVATYGWNNVTDEPFRFLYEFGYYSDGGAVVYIKDNINMQDARVFKLSQLEHATAKQLKSLYYGE